MRVAVLVRCLAAALAMPACTKTECPAGSVFVPAGTFVMGAEIDKTRWHWPSQLKPRKVTLTRSYCMERTEVTYQAYDECGAAKACTWRHGEPVPPSMRKLPVAFIDWADAVRYCTWRGGRLPSEAEWEYAARYPDGRLYPWGNDPPTHEHWWWRDGDRSKDETIDVGSLPKGRSYLGLDDMSGNQAEWVQDNFGMHDQQPDIDPVGPDDYPDDFSMRVVRGGSWASVDVSEARATYRQNGDRVYGDDQTGFRCVYPPR